MANERTVPIMPCSSVDEIRDFYLPLGFEVTYRQLKPNPYLSLRREDLHLHYFGLESLRPEDSYSSCLVLVEDTEALFEAFAAGLRGHYGKLPLTGFPRITRPRRRKNAGGMSGFSLIDPAGNWIRIMRAPGDHDAAARPAGGRLAQALANAVVLADSHGDAVQAAKILAGALARTEADAAVQGAPLERLEALAFLAELYLRLERHADAAARLAELDAVPLPAADRPQAAEIFAQAGELRRQLGGPAIASTGVPGYALAVGSEEGRTVMQKITPCLWFNTEGEEAAQFYTSLFENSRILEVSRYGEGGPGPEGQALTVKFELDGHEFTALNGGPAFTFSEAVSLQVDCKDQEEVDKFWNALTAEGEESQCGWLKDKYGLSWQIIPSELPGLIGGPDPAGAQRAMQAMLAMKKIDIGALKTAYGQP